MKSPRSSYFLAVGFANDAFDHELLNSADSVAARLRSDGRHVWADLPPAAQSILRYNKRKNLLSNLARILGSEVPGSGLGLAIVTEIAVAHNADVTLDTGPDGIGTTVTVTFMPAVVRQPA